MTKRKQLTKTQREQIHNMFGGRCAYCGCKIDIKDMQADHIIALNRGGTDTTDNMYPACRSCNHYKSTYSIKEFRQNIEKWTDRLMRDSVTYKNAVRFGLVIPNPHHVNFYFEKSKEGKENA